jgi:hypothetical protein
MLAGGENSVNICAKPLKDSSKSRKFCLRIDFKVVRFNIDFSDRKMTLCKSQRITKLNKLFFR